MRYFAVLAGFAALALAKPMPQGVTAVITPTAAAPPGCTDTYPTFEVSVANASFSAQKKSKSKRATLVISLNKGVLTDDRGETGYIAANDQFQFDKPAQTGAIYTGGFSVCANGTIALGGSAIWYECLSGTFYNLYDTNWAPQCKEIFLQAIKVDGSLSVTTAAVTVTSDGQVGATTAISAVTSSAAVVTSITDHQIQGPTTTTAVTSSIAVVTSAVTTIIPVTSSAAIVTSISDHQIQAPTTTSVVVSSIALVSSISDHQIQAPTSTSVVTVTPYTGGAALPTMAAQLILAAAGAAAVML